MKRILLGLITIGVIGSSSISYADVVNIPFCLKLEAFKKELKEKGFNAYGGDNADGEIENFGTSIKVITYKPVSIEKMEVMKDVAMHHVRY